MEGRVALVTGAGGGIGKATVRELAARGAHVFATCRSAGNVESLLREIRAAVPHAHVDGLVLDLADFASIRACAADFLSRAALQ